MKFPIGFAFNDEPKKVEMEPLVQQATVPVKSLAQVYFPERNQTLTYFNDQFDLKRGDFVFVDGKLEGIRGVVREVNKNFKIKVADYKKIISVADTNVSGRLHMVGSHFVSFDPAVVPYEKIRTWYLAPVKPEDEYETGKTVKNSILTGRAKTVSILPTPTEHGVWKSPVAPMPKI